MKSTISRTNEEEMLKILGEQVPVGVCIMQDGRFCYVNSNFPLAIGYTVDELLGKDSSEIVFPEDSGMVRENTIKMLKGELTSPYQFRVIHKNGSIVWVMATVKSTEYQGRRATLGNYMEITERKGVEDALRESEERYRELANSVTDIFFAMDDHLRYTYWNKASEILTGIRAEDALGKSIREIFPDTPGRRNAEKVYRNVLRTQQPQIFMNDFNIDGKHYVFEISAYPSQGGISVFVRDITKRKKTEEELNLQKVRFQQLFDNSPDAIIMIDIDDRLIHANKGFEALFGYSTEELQGQSIRRLIVPEEDAQATSASLQKVFNGEVVRRETVRRRKDNSLVDVSTLSYPIRLDDKVVGACFTYTDITRHKKAEAALRQSEENYKTLFDSATIGMYVLDAETMKVVAGNRAAREMAGFKSEREGIGVNPFDFVVPEDKGKVLEVAITDFLQDSLKPREIRVMDKDGRRRWLSISSTRIMHEGRLAALVSIMDITERKQAEEALRQSEENYRALFDSTVIGTIVIDGETMKVVMANQAAAKILGLSSVEEGIGANPLDFVHPDDREGISKIIVKDMFEQDLRRTNELRVKTNYGREIWISATGARIVYQGRLAGLISFTDITEQKQQAEQLMLTDRLASIGELAAGAAHELNNPLTSVIGFSQLLMEKDISDDVHQDLTFIYSEAQRAVSITKNLLAFARKHKPVKRLSQINEIIEDVLKLRTYEHKIHDIKVEKQLAPDLPESMVDYFQMQQVFFNIVINAEYFMTEAHDRGTLTITTEKQNGAVTISFADDGPGIPVENLSQIFNPFFTTKETGKGTGLGLSICHGVVSEHGGKIHARSQPGEGATILVELPINGS